MQKDYSEYVPSEQEQYQLRRRGNEFINFKYFNNRARFNPERRTLDIQVDGKKGSLWMDELVEEYESAREERGGEEFLGLDEDGTEENWQDNEEDVSQLDKHYRISYFPFEDLIKRDQLTETFGLEPRNVPVNNVLSGTDVHLKWCGRYFILKWNFNLRYCDLVEEWCNRTCREFAAQENKRPPAGVFSCRRFFDYRIIFFVLNSLMRPSHTIAICESTGKSIGYREKLVLSHICNNQPALMEHRVVKDACAV